MGRKVSNISQKNTAVTRPRLNQTLEALTANHIVWLVAAGGYGKTTLALDYLTQHRIDHLYLPIPDANQAEAFIRQWWHNIPDGTAVFLDDLHHLPEQHPVQPLVLQFVESLHRAGHPVLIASRHEPSPVWARLRAQNLLAFVEEADLAFTAEEQQELFKQTPLAGGLNALSIEAGGWAAGLVLLMEHSRREPRQNEQRLLQRNLNDWFEQQVFAPLPREYQQLLVRVACARHIPDSLVAQVTELPGAKKVLEQLYLQHAFVREEHHPALGPCYLLHDLFREFLLQRSESLLSIEERQYWQRRWGEALWQAGNWTEAATLLIDTGAVDALAKGLREQAGTLLQQGRGDQLHGWIKALPETLLDEDVQLQVWLGLCLIVTDSRAARATLTSAWNRLSKQQDSQYKALAWCGIVDSIWLEWAHISEYEPWVDALLAVEAEFRSTLPPALWFKVLRGMLTALGYSRPGSDELKRWHQEGLSAISNQAAPADERLMMASQLMYLSTWQFGRRADAFAVVSIVNQSPHLIKQASPLAQCLWATFDSLWSLLFEADRERCLEKAEQGRELIRTHDISTWDNAIPPIHCALCFHDKSATDDWVSWFMRTELKAHRPFYDTFQAHVLAGQAWLNGHLHEAIEHARRSVEAMHRHGSEAISAGFEAIYASLLSEAGHHAQALRSAALAKRAFHSFDSGFVDVMLFLTLARIPLHREQPERALPFIRRAFSAGARERLFFPVLIRNDELATLAALALRENIEPGYVHWLISQRQLPPPNHRGLRLSWPWPCRLMVLGRFDVEHLGEPLGRVPQKRTRALLSELVLAGREGLPLDHLARALWPDSEPDKAANSLHVTTHRAREALNHADAVTVDAGQMRLNPNHVWVDCWELEDLALQAGTLTEHSLQQAVSLYRGRLHLDTIDDTQTAILQETLNHHYLTLVQHLGKRLEHSDAQQARQLYRQAQRHLPLDQHLWAGLLRTEAALGNARTLELTFEQARALYQNELDSEPPEPLLATYERLKAGEFNP